MTRFGGSITVPLDTLNPSFTTSKENDLIEVSDDEEEDDEESEEEEDEDLDEDLDELEEDDEEELDNEEIKVLKLDLNNDIDESNLEFDNVDDLDELENQLSSNINLETIPEEFNHEDEHVFSSSDLKTININLEESVDYKKLPLNKLRSVVVEKGLIHDSSKLKKNELLKLLGVE
jgi:hypothetical protein